MPRHMLLFPLRIHLHRLAFTPSRHASLRAYAGVARSDAQKKTIYALSTPAGKAGVGVVRVSGPNSLEVWRTMVKTSHAVAVPDPWKMHRCDIVHPTQQQTVLDSGLAVFFRGPRSFTTEDVLELHIHSGRAIISSVLGALGTIQSCRPAEPGEFTKRAFLGGRLDLTQVEGMKDLIDADTESQRKVALNATQGTLRTHYEHIRHEIIKCLANMEAIIDFGENDAIEDGIYEKTRSRVKSLRDTIQHNLSDNRRGEIIRTGIKLVIFGPPNAGKSSLFNFLAQREAAIVTPVPGTTRDTLELSLDIGGLPVVISDTAGFRATNDLVESIGIQRAKQAVQAADISLCVLSLAEMGSTFTIPASLKKLITPDTFFLLNKADLINHPLEKPPKAWVMSLNDGGGTDQFLDEFAAVLQGKYNYNDSQAPLITHTRHRIHLLDAQAFLDAFLDTDDVVLGAEELRYAAQAIGKVSGIIDIDDLLDSIFHDFCIGK